MAAEFLSDIRVSYDTVAAVYAERSRDDLVGRPLDRAVLGAFAELVRAGGPVADVGCGPGQVTGRLAALGVSAFGIDLSREMLAVARKSWPRLRFVEGSMTGLPVAAGSLGGLLAWYSIIHLPDEVLPGVFAGFHRVVRSGGYVLVAFQAGDESVRLAEAFGRPVALDFHRRAPERVEALLVAAGFAVVARTVREPDGAEGASRAFLLAVKPGAGDGEGPPSR